MKTWLMKTKLVKTRLTKTRLMKTRLVKACGALGVAAAAAVAAPYGQTAPAGDPPTDAEILALISKHCVQCHAVQPTHEAFARPPQGVVLETIEEISRNAPKIMSQVVIERAMPLGNQTGMTDAERDRLAAWIESRK
jgi:uncharacterized membrane protein